MEAVSAYYDGRVFVPVKPVSAKKNQRAIVAILDDDYREAIATVSDNATIADGRGILKGSSFTVDRFIKFKTIEKELEDGR